MTHDVVVIGGGAAGIAATRRLHEAGIDVLLLEASGRLGGRAHTVRVRGEALDLGCAWLHSADRNPWTRIALAEGFQIDRTPPGWREQWHDLGFHPPSGRCSSRPMPNGASVPKGSFMALTDR